MDDDFVNCHQESLNKVIKEIKRTRNWVIIDPKCRLREKVAAILSFFGIKVTRYVWYKTSVGRRKILK